MHFLKIVEKYKLHKATFRFILKTNSPNLKDGVKIWSARHILPSGYHKIKIASFLAKLFDNSFKINF